MSEAMFPCICGQQFPVGRDQCPYCDCTSKVIWYWDGKEACEVSVYDKDEVTVGIKGESKVRHGITNLPDGLALAFGDSNSKRPSFLSILLEMTVLKKIHFYILVILTMTFWLLGWSIPLTIVCIWFGILVFGIIEISVRMATGGFPSEWESWLTEVD